MDRLIDAAAAERFSGSERARISSGSDGSPTLNVEDIPATRTPGSQAAGMAGSRWPSPQDFSTLVRASLIFLSELE
jgi:hypothetical protein